MQIRIVDAFADRPFTGNPAGVVLFTDAFPEDDWLQRVAMEVNHAETAFAHPLPEGTDGDGAAWALRWFTPTTEVDLCGHATLATAHVLHTTGAATGTIGFRTRAGILTATAHGDGTLTLDFPTAPLTEAEPPTGLAEALGAELLSCYDAGPYCGDVLVELADEKTVRGLAPDLAGLVRHSERGLIATARAEDPTGDYAFVSRGFFPRVGIDEDPVTGSAHTALAPYWSPRLGSTELTGLQASARTGLVRTSLKGERTLLTGRAITTIDGRLLV
ncbi:PhzF family phenazine biosynthesis protein [Streptomyces sp. NPDC002851]